jgi:hypothetical protein
VISVELATGVIEVIVAGGVFASGSSIIFLGSSIIFLGSSTCTYSIVGGKLVNKLINFSQQSLQISLSATIISLFSFIGIFIIVQSLDSFWQKSQY